jgi:hypothetical protein
MTERKARAKARRARKADSLRGMTERKARTKAKAKTGAKADPSLCSGDSLRE